MVSCRFKSVGNIMMLVEPISARWATPSDIEFLKTAGRSHLPENILQRKIPWNEVAVAEADGALAGYLYLDHIWSSVPFISIIWVSESHRKKGVGRALLGFVEMQARAQGCEMLYSSSQLDEPEPQAWHRHMGFEECGIWSGHNDGVGEVFFRKRL